MCYYNGQKVEHAEFIRLKQIEKLVVSYGFLNRPAYESDGFKYLNTAVLKRKDGEEDFDIVPMEWGFIPPFWRNREEVDKFRKGFKDPVKGWVQYLTLNAKSEEMLLPKKIFRDAALHRRCLVLSTGFVESQHYFPKNKRTGLPIKTPSRQPYYITIRNQPYFFMAGLWQNWIDKDTGESVETVTIVTTTAVGNKVMEQVHNEKLRMPTILNEDLAWEWLFGDLCEERISAIAQTQFPSEFLQTCPIERGYKDAENPFQVFKYEDSPILVI